MRNEQSQQTAAKVDEKKADESKKETKAACMEPKEVPVADTCASKTEQKKQDEKPKSSQDKKAACETDASIEKKPGMTRWNL